MSDETLLNAREASELAKVSGKTIAKWIKAGLLPTIKVGREKMIRKTVLQQIMRDRFEFEHGRLPRDTLTKLNS